MQERNLVGVQIAIMQSNQAMSIRPIIPAGYAKHYEKFKFKHSNNSEISSS
jgi:hypothetical protein